MTDFPQVQRIKTIRELDDFVRARRHTPAPDHPTEAERNAWRARRAELMRDPKASGGKKKRGKQ